MHSADFLESLTPRTSETKAVRRFFRIIFWIGFFIVSIVVAYLLTLSIFGYLVYTNAKEAISAVKKLDAGGASIALSSAKHWAGVLHGELVIIEPFERIPLIGPQFQSARLSAEAAIDGFTAAEMLMVPFGDSVKSLATFKRNGTSSINAYRSMPSDAKRELLQNILDSAPIINKAAGKIREADETLRQIPSDDISSVLRAKINPVQTALHEIRVDFDAFSSMARLLPELLVKGGERNMILVFQNSDELRPTGGFIGTYGIFNAKDGDFSLSDIRDVYTLDRPASKFFKETPPEPLAKYLASTNWYFRDANWSPHFPESAARLLDFYVRERGERGSEMDGVIAVNPRVIEGLSKLVGCITVQQIDFCPENILARVQYQVEKGYDLEGIPDAERKQIIIPLATEFLKRLYELPIEKLPEVFDVVRNSFLKKDIQMWSSDTNLQGAIIDAGIAGQLSYDTSDGFMVVDANLGGMKTDPYVKREITYKVEQNGENYIGTISIKYKNTAPEENWKWTTYRTWTRVFLPLGSEWLSTEGSLENDRGKNPEMLPGKTAVQDELGFTSFGTFTAIGIGEERMLTFYFRLAPQVVRSIRRFDYSLTVLREPGSPDPALTLDLGFDKKLKVKTDLSVDRKFILNEP
ncbi:MAG: DUF4012 domain-containing protein [bacterium]